MPGPFPGMDPYLEDPAGWQGVHNTLITFVYRAILRDLPDAYDAGVEERCYIIDPGRHIVPDLTVFEGVPTPARARGNAAVLLPDAPLVLRTAPIEVREAYIHIYRAGDRSRVVTAIEILSPTNKAANTEGNRIYRQKQAQVLATRTHLLEIDLLRQGEHTVAFPRTALPANIRWDYILSLHRSGIGEESLELWPATVRERLPRVSIPLDPGDADLVLDMQAVLSQYYDELFYGRRLDYSREPVPPLREEDREWADALVREKGVRAQPAEQ